MLLTSFRARYDAFPGALRVLHGWLDMDPNTRKLICHWHLALTDPLYRAFTGTYLPDRRGRSRSELTRAVVVNWVDRQEPGRWGKATQIQFATRLLSASLAAGLVLSRRDPRSLSVPRVPDEALEYLLHVLRETEFEGTLFSNPYLRSVGLEGRFLEDRLRKLPSLQFRKQGGVFDVDWRYGDLAAWHSERAVLLDRGEAS